MTFTEAALHVLRLVGKPLHYKEITDVAIEKDFLSHVGKSPEVTMGARLAAVVKKGDKDNPLTRVKPGVFALAEWSQEVINKGLSDRTPALTKIAQVERNAPAAADDAGAPAVHEADSSAVGLPIPELGAKPEDLGADEIARAEMSAAANSIFEAEDDDDEPILGGDDDEEADDGARRAPAAGGLGRNRRGRRRRGGPVREDDDLPSYTVSEASDEVIAEVAEVVRERSEGDAESGGRDRHRGRDRGRGRDREGGQTRDAGREAPREGGQTRDAGREAPREGGQTRDAGREGGRDAGREGGRDRDAGREGGRDRDAGRDVQNRDGERDERKPREGLRLDELSAAPLADVAEETLFGFQRQGGASAKQLAEAAARRNKGVVEPQAISAACRADNLRRVAKNERARFQFQAGGRIALVEWTQDKDLLRLEREARAAAKKYQEALRQKLLRRLAELQPRAAAELLMLLLERVDYGQFKVVKRQGAHPSELHLSAVLSAAAGELPVAIVFRRDGRDIGRERVTDLRGSLHHYAGAALGLLVTTGNILSGAREEAAVPGATPVSFVDGAQLAKLCEQYGVGVVQSYVSLPAPDAEFFESLRANGG
ncbi:MAG: hypothetical protein RJA70_2170 [Pseudomonadota bacterium]|jgi:hypothetical protein